MYRDVKAYVICCFLVIVATASSMQAQVKVDITKDNQRDSIIKSATDYLGTSSLLQTGTEYIGYSPAINGHPYYVDDSTFIGNVFYDGILYKNAPLKYDLVQDELILFPIGNKVPIKLLKEKLLHFQLGNETFIKMVSDSTSAGLGTSGFYQELHRGKVTVVAKLKKQILESRKIDEASRFVQYETFFLKKGNLYYPVNSNSELLALLKDRRDDLRKFQRSEKLNFRTNRIETIQRTAAHYSQITQ